MITNLPYVAEIVCASSWYLLRAVSSAWVRFVNFSRLASFWPDVSFGRIRLIFWEDTEMTMVNRL
jgi:hypothetical protein